MTPAIDSAPEATVAPESSIPRSRRGATGLQIGLLLAIMALGVWTRLHELGAESFWYDEAVTFERSSLPIPKLIADSVNRYHVPTYFMFMHYLLPFGDDEWSMRLPSAIFGVLKIPVIAAAGWILGGAPVGLGAALLLVLSPQQLRYDQEARMYAVQTFLLAIALLCQLWLLSRPQPAVRCWVRGETSGLPPDDARALRNSRMAWIGWVLAVVAALYVHNMSALYLPASSCATLALLLLEPSVRKRMFWHWTVANLVVLALWAPWLPQLFGQLGGKKFTEVPVNHPPPLAFVLSQTRILMLGGGSRVINWIMAALTLAGIWQLRKRPVILIALLLLSLLAPAQCWLLSQVKPFFIPRLFLWGGLAACVLAAHGLLVAGRGWPTVLLTGLSLGALTILGVQDLESGYYARRFKPDWRGAAKLLNAYHDMPDVALFGINFRERRIITYYSERKTDPTPTPPVVDLEPKRAPALTELPEGKRRILFIYGSQLKRGRRPALIRRAARKGQQTCHRSFLKVTVDCYELPDRSRRSKR